MKSGRINKIPW